jgi:hypothetical protein
MDPAHSMSHKTIRDGVWERHVTRLCSHHRVAGRKIRSMVCVADS